MLADRLLQHVLSFSLKDVALPQGVGVLDPFNGANADEVRRIVTLFHRKYFSDDRERVLMLGINPGRFGAGLTGIAFTDPEDCKSVLGIDHTIPDQRPEASSRFFANVVKAAGGAEAFYARVYVSSVFPLGFTTVGTKGNEVNLNYYDRKDLMDLARPVAKQWLTDLQHAGCRKDVVICLGKGENARFLSSLHVFDQVIALDHPRYIMQYKSKDLMIHTAKYIAALDAVH